MILHVIAQHQYTQTNASEHQTFEFDFLICGTMHYQQYVKDVFNNHHFQMAVTVTILSLFFLSFLKMLLYRENYSEP